MCEPRRLVDYMGVRKERRLHLGVSGKKSGDERFSPKRGQVFDRDRALLASEALCTCLKTEMPNIIFMKRILTFVFINILGKSTGCPSFASMHTGSMPSSPYVSCTIPPLEFRTVPSYMVDKSSNDCRREEDLKETLFVFA